MKLRHFAAFAATAVSLLAAGAASGSPQTMSIVYDEQGAAQEIFTGPNALTPAKGGYRQAPSTGGVFRGNADHHQVGKVNGHDLSRMGSAGMARHLRSAVDRSPSGMVAVDEIGNAFRDPKMKITYKNVRVNGKTIRIASHNRVVVLPNGGGYRVEKTVMSPPVPPESNPGRKLTRAMQQLSRIRHRSGKSYAQRVHFYMAPAFVTAIAVGNGDHFTMDGTGTKSLRPGWRGVIDGLALSGGVWLQMYHGNMFPVEAQVWRNAPQRITGYLARHAPSRGGSAPVRLLFTNAGSSGPIGAPSGCGSPMACQWALAASTPAGLASLKQGAGAYRVDDQAGEWLAQWNRYVR